LADKVIIIGTKRFDEYVSTSEIRQMAGRCGRGHGADGNVIIFDSDRTTKFSEDAIFGAPAPVESSLSDTVDAAFNLLPLMRDGKCDETKITKWLDKTLLQYQSKTLPIKECLINLLENCCIKEIGGQYSITPIGIVSCDFYFYPGEVFSWQKNFTTIEKKTPIKEELLAWAIGNISDESQRNVGYLSEEAEEAFSDLSCLLEKYSLDIGSASKFSCLSWHCLLTGRKIKGLENSVRNLKSDYPRIERALSEIFKDNLTVKMIISKLKDQVRYNAPMEYSWLSQIPKITKTHMKLLSSMNISNIGELRDCLDSQDLPPVLILLLKEFFNGNKAN